MLVHTLLKKGLIQLWILFLFFSNLDTVAPSRPDDQYENLQHLMDERRAEFWNAFESDLYLNQLPTDVPSLADAEPASHQEEFETSLSTEATISLTNKRFKEEKQGIQWLGNFFSGEMADEDFSMSSEMLDANNDHQNGPKGKFDGSPNELSSSKIGKIKSAKKYFSSIKSKDEIINLRNLHLISSGWGFDHSPLNNRSAIDGYYKTNDGGLMPSSDSDERPYNDQITNNKLRNFSWREEGLQRGNQNGIHLDGNRRKSPPDNLIFKQRKRHRQNGGQEKRSAVHSSIQEPKHIPKENEEFQSRKLNRFDGPLYTKWSKWSRCSKHCQQTRRRRCRVPSLCGSALNKESRPCLGWKCQHENFHLIQPEEIGPNFEATDESQPAPRADVRVLLNYNSMFYTKWSQWSACSRTCLTSRYRSCRYPLFCGNAVIREEAYCYIQNTPCEKWYQRHKRGPDNKNGFDEKLNKVYYDISSPFGQVQNNATANVTNRVSTNQVVFGHNKFFTENLPISPEDNAHILNIDVGSSSHRFTPNRQRHRTNNKPQHGQKNDVIANIDLGKHTPNSHWANKNKYIINKQREHENEIFIPQAPSKLNPLKKPGFINNVANVYDRDVQRKINIKQETPDFSSSYPSSMSIGRPSVLPKQCGRSIIRKPPWNLKIIGGRESPTDKWPWQVAILNRFKEVFCGGTLVADQWVLTAAHCLRKRLYARLAEHDLAITDGNEVDFKVTETVPHPLYDSTTVDNDVALLRLPTPIEVGSKIAPACVPEQGSQLPVGQECTIIGWGKEEHNHFFGTEVLHEAETRCIGDSVCEDIYNRLWVISNTKHHDFQYSRVIDFSQHLQKIKDFCVNEVKLLKRNECLFFILSCHRDKFFYPTFMSAASISGRSGESMVSFWRMLEDLDQYSAEDRQKIRDELWIWETTIKGIMEVFHNSKKKTRIRFVVVVPPMVDLVCNISQSIFYKGQVEFNDRNTVIMGSYKNILGVLHNDLMNYEKVLFHLKLGCMHIYNAHPLNFKYYSFYKSFEVALEHEKINKDIPGNWVKLYGMNLYK